MHSIPKAGDFIYLGSELYLSHGEDDIIGGLAEIMRVEQTGGDIGIVFKLWPASRYSWDFLSRDQEKLKKIFGNSLAHARPDHRPQFNE